MLALLSVKVRAHGAGSLVPEHIMNVGIRGPTYAQADLGSSLEAP
jgi:hypothetical protein